MRILFISNLYPPEVLGGAETYLERLATEMARQGNQVAVFTTGRRAAREERDGVTVIRRRAFNFFALADFPRRRPWQKFLWRAGAYVAPRNLLADLDEVLATWRPELIHTQNVQGFPLHLFDLLRRSRCPLVHTIHDYYFLCPRLSLLHRNGRLCPLPGATDEGSAPPTPLCRVYRSTLRRRVEALYHAVVAPSRFVLDAHLDAGFFRGTTTGVIPLGSTFPPRPRRTKDRSGTLRLLALGALTRHKGMNLLLDLPGYLDGVPFRLDVAGAGEYADDWRLLAQRDDRVRFHGFVAGADKEALFASADLFILPSVWFDNSPVVIYESFSFGLPVLASRIGGIPELIEDNRNGYLFPPGDVEALARLVRGLSERPDELDRLSAGAWHTSGELTFRRHGDRLLEVYQHVRGVAR